MKVTRRMLHPDLQPFSVYYLQKMSSIFTRNKNLFKITERILSKMIKSKLPSNIHSEERSFLSRDGVTQIRVLIFRPKSHSGVLPPMLYTHGGGYLGGSPDVFTDIYAKFIDKRPCVIVAPAYRTALKQPYPAAFNDCYDTLLWMRDNADKLSIDPRKFMIAGHSAGGGLTAAVTLKARDTKDANIALQMPFYPMIDNLQPTDPARSLDVPGWDTKSNALGWNSYLKDLYKREEEIPPYAAPSRNKDYSNLPPTITYVGDLEPFYWETVEYTNNLKEAGVDVCFKVFEKVTHGPEFIVPKSSLGKECFSFTFENYALYYDKYIAQKE